MAKRHQSSHPVDMRLLLVFVALMVLLAVAMAVHWMPHTWWTNLISMTVAVAKTLLVMLYFMHLRFNKDRAVLTAAVTGLVMLGIFALLVASDYLTR